MKPLFLAIATLLLANTLVAQNPEIYIDEEECGCELYFIDGIQKT